MITGVKIQMLCDKCKKVEATVHITEVVAEAPERTNKHDLCEACFSQSDLAKKVNANRVGWTSYISFLSDDESSR